MCHFTRCDSPEDRDTPKVSKCRVTSDQLQWNICMETRSHLRSQNECINVNKVVDKKPVVVLQRDFQQMSANVRIPVRPYVILQDGNGPKRSATVEDFLSHFMIKCMDTKKSQPM